MPSARAAWMVGLIVFMASGLDVGSAAAQRPFRVYDPFYRNETARRSFFDGYAFTTEVSYRSASSVQDDGLADPDPFGFSFRADYELAPQFDVSAILDASGDDAGRRVSLSWVALKYYRHVETADYALRLAVDPTADGRVGFPQVDLAFIYTSALSPMVSSDFAIGLRRVRIGFEQLEPSDEVEGGEDPLAGPDEPPGYQGPSTPLEVTYTRAHGWELHAMMNYSVLLDPAGSNLFVAVFGELSSYDLIDLSLSGSLTGEAEEAASSSSQTARRAATLLNGTADEAPEAPSDDVEYRGGVVWLRSGLSFNRPSYQLMPFISVPVRQWMPEEGEWHRARLHVGFRFMLR